MLFVQILPKNSFFRCKYNRLFDYNLASSDDINALLGLSQFHTVEIVYGVGFLTSFVYRIDSVHLLVYTCLVGGSDVTLTVIIPIPIGVGLKRNLVYFKRIYGE